MNQLQVIDTLAALAQESRLQVFRLLVRRGTDGAAAGDIAEALGLPATTLSFHLKTLCEAGLCSARREGRQIFYLARIGTVTTLIDYLTENCCREQSSQPQECP